MDIETAIRLLQENRESVPKPLRLPTPAEVDAAESDLGLTFHPDYRRFQLEASDCVFGVLEPALVLPDLMPYLDLRKTATDAWSLGAPKDALPFCHDNGNYYLLNADGKIGFWDHDDGSANFGAGTLADWIVEDWLEMEA